MRRPFVLCPVCSPGAAPAAEAVPEPPGSGLGALGDPKGMVVCALGTEQPRGASCWQEKRGVFCSMTYLGAGMWGAAAGLGRDLGTAQPLRSPRGRQSPPLARGRLSQARGG